MSDPPPETELRLKKGLARGKAIMAFSILAVLCFGAGCGSKGLSTAEMAYVNEIDARLRQLTNEVETAASIRKQEIGRITAYGDERDQYFAGKIEAAQREQRELRLKKLEFLASRSMPAPKGVNP
jgi:hypothetical protein